MKKYNKIILLIIMILIVFTSCTSNEVVENEVGTKNVSQDGQNEQGNIMKLGRLTMSNLTEEEAEEIEHYYHDSVKQRIIFYDNISTAILAVKSKKIDGIVYIPRSTARYIVTRNDDLLIHPAAPNKSTGTIRMCNYRMAVKDTNTDLFIQINNAIKDMKKDGTVNHLIVEKLNAYIDANENPEKVVIPKKDGVRTLRVAVTGALPPMDFVSADGEPAGFNVAFLVELSNRINMNVELVNIDVNSRSLALSSGKVDAIFWTYTPGEADDDVGILKSGKKLSEVDIPEHVLLTEAYFEDEVSNVFNKGM